MTKQTEERRRQPRAKGTAGLTVGLEPESAAIQVKDVSLSGISFRTREPIEFMTQLMMTLVFPTTGGAKSRATDPYAVRCEGAVVRCDRRGSKEENQYEIAVFFTHLDENARKAIEEYVQTHS